MKDKQDCFSHDKETNPSIEICLNCTRPKCNGSCELITKQKGDYIIQHTYTKKNGDKNINYVVYVNPNKKSITTTRYIESAKRYTEQGVKDALALIKNKSGPQSTFEVIKVNKK